MRWKTPVKGEQTLRKEWAKKGFSCAPWVDPPWQCWENYVHDVDEVVTVVEGEMEFEIGGKKHTLKPGDEAFIPAGVTHSARNLGRVTARWYYGYKRPS